MEKVIDKRPDNTVVLSGRYFLSQQASEQSLALKMAIFAGTISTILMITQWVAFALLAENVIVDKLALHDSIYLLALILFCIVAKAATTRLQTFLSQRASLHIRQNIRQLMLKHWQTSSPLYLRDKSTGSFASQFVEEIETMDGYFARYWPQQALCIISPILILAVVAYFNWLCALLLFISAPLIPLFMVLVGMGAENLNQKYSTIRQRLSGHFLDRVANLLSIRLLGAQEEVLQEVDENSEQYRNVIMKTLKVAFLSSTVLEFFTSVAIAALAIYIGFSLYGAIAWGPADSLSLFSGLVILILAPEFFQPLRILSQYYHDRASALGAANNLVETLQFNGNKDRQDTLLEYSPTNELKPVSSPQQPNESSTTIAIKDLSVGYDPSNVLCKNLNIALQKGEMLVISGQSGTGKTSLLNTLAGYLPALNGSVSIVDACGGENNSAKAYLPQKPWIKNATIFENISALAPEATEQQILPILKQLGLLEELDLTRRGTETVVGEHGQGLSGGQMQRLAFARLLINPTPLIFMDEPTAKLDPRSKTFIIEALKTLQQNATLVIATHDPLLIDMADHHLNLNIALSKDV